MPKHSIEQLKRVLDYCPDTGVFTWKVYRGSVTWPGALAGGLVKGYIIIHYDGATYRAHNLAWAFMTGEWPLELVDHEDRDGTNNKWNNLRAASHWKNRVNSVRKNGNAVGHRGVYFDKRTGGWTAVIGVDYKSIYLGYFKDIEEAIKARLAAERLYFDEFSPKVTQQKQEPEDMLTERRK
jgi:hypothetical protein